MLDIAHQFQRAKKLPYLEWVIPNAPENRDAMQTAWYAPTALPSMIPSRPELQDDEDEDGMRQSIKYLLTLVDELRDKGIPLNRIVIAGFSQGCVMSLLLGFASKYADQFAGIGGLAGYFALPDRIEDMREEDGLSRTVGESRMPVYVMRGGSDILVPRRYYGMLIDKLKELGVRDEDIAAKEYPGVGHSLSGAVLQDLCTWLEKIVPPLD